MFFCKASNSSFTAKSSIVNKHGFISKPLKVEVLIKSAEKQTITFIARDCAVLPSTFQRRINEKAKPFQFMYPTSPEHLSFDEFKSGKVKMIFKYINVETGELSGILRQRNGKR